MEEESRIIYTIEDNTASIKALKYKDTEGKFYSYSSRRSYSKNYKLENFNNKTCCRKYNFSREFFR